MKAKTYLYRNSRCQRTASSFPRSRSPDGFFPQLSLGGTSENRYRTLFEGVTSLLQLFAARQSIPDYLKDVVHFLARWCNCSSAAIRLVAPFGHLPFAYHVGFPPSFLEGENACALRPSKPCACFRILFGKRKRSDAAFTTSRGSVFCNSVCACAGTLDHSGSSAKPLPCVVAGYNSLAHIPIRHHGRLLGTLHLADLHPERISLETVIFLEAITPLIGETLHEFSANKSATGSEAHFRLMFERHDAVMLLVAPRSGAIVDANPAAVAFYGYSRDRLRHMTVDQIDALSRPEVKRRLQRRGRSGSFSGIIPQRLANGSLRTVEVFGSPMRLGRQNIVLAIIQDITERRLLERAVLENSERERQRLGQDLHDSLGGKLTGAALIAKALAGQLTAANSTSANLAEEIVKGLHDSLLQVASISHGLCPPELAASDLVGALQELARELNRLPGLHARFLSPTPVQVRDLFVATHLFRIAREAANNALRHGAARNITFRLALSRNRLRLEIRDDGSGLPSNTNGNGLGLRSMKYRASAIGGQLLVRPNRGLGVTVSCFVPLANLEAQSANP